MAESKAGSFSAYLEYAQRGLPDAPPRAAGPASLLSILNSMPEAGIAIGQLAELSGMAAPAFREGLKKLSDCGFFEVSGEPLSEVAKLTAKGRDDAALL